jgi:hypothetical protein
MDAGAWIAVLALALSGVSLVFTFLERRARVTELDLLRRQVEGQESEREGRQLADLYASHGGISGGSPFDQHEIFLVNGGPAIARAIDIFVRDEAETEIVGKRRCAPFLAPQGDVIVLLDVPQERSRQGGLTMWARWRDDSGDREEPIIPLHRLV